MKPWLWVKTHVYISARRLRVANGSPIIKRTTFVFSSVSVLCSQQKAAQTALADKGSVRILTINAGLEGCAMVSQFPRYLKGLLGVHKTSYANF